MRGNQKVLDDLLLRSLEQRFVDPHALEVALGAATDLPLPPTRSATSDSDAYVVVVRINGFAAQSKSLWLFDGTIFLPAAAQNATW